MPPTFWIIDGVRRVELRVLVDVNGATRSGLFGSLAVGGVRIGERAEISRVAVSRALILAGGLRPPDTMVASSEGAALECAGVTVAEIDEGFGALDTDETLDQVIQSLEALQTNHQVLGVVTHLTQLAKWMPAHIRVRKAP